LELVLQDGTILTEGPLTADLFPEPVMELVCDDILVEYEDDILIPTTLKNQGPVGAMVASNVTEVEIKLCIINESGVMIRNYSRTVPIPNPDTMENISIPVSVSGIPAGKYSLKLELSDITGIPFDPMKRIQMEKTMYLLEEGSISVERDPKLDDFGFIGKAFKVYIRNPSNRTIPISRVVLYNGVPGDEVVIAESFVTWIGPNETFETALPLGLEEGLYLLSIEATTSRSTDTSVPWVEGIRDSTTFEFTVEKYIPPEQEDNEVDMDDVTDSVLIGSSAVISVILVSALFRRKTEEDEK
jgi:hypothetical protein